MVDLFKKILDFTAKVAEEDSSVTPFAFSERSAPVTWCSYGLRCILICFVSTESYYVFLGLDTTDFSVFNIALITSIRSSTGLSIPVRFFLDLSYADYFLMKSHSVVHRTS